MVLLFYSSFLNLRISQDWYRTILVLSQTAVSDFTVVMSTLKIYGLEIQRSKQEFNVCI
jgi:hypothetical protein